jgi:hypothetical protein
MWRLIHPAFKWNFVKIGEWTNGNDILGTLTGWLVPAWESTTNLPKTFESHLTLGKGRKEESRALSGNA